MIPAVLLRMFGISR